METKVYIKGTSIYDEKETREISLEKICETFGLDAMSVKFCMGKDMSEIFVIPTPDYGLIVDGSVGTGIKKDLYGLANVAFNSVNGKDGFYTQVFPGLYSAADVADDACCEEGAPILVVNQQKRERDDDSVKLIYYESALAAPLAAGEGDEMLANTLKELENK
ncbi:MAG: hypothetical protein IJI14_08110 [Anaerolineaceae bacterium]|nr:hypothetical protein [Anaerolineaceae bacterium]